LRLFLSSLLEKYLIFVVMKKSLLYISLLSLAFGLVVVPNAQAETDVSDGCVLLTSTLEVGSKGDEVFALETFLKKQKLFKSAPNKTFNKATEKALIAYQLQARVIQSDVSEQAGKTAAATRDAIANASCKKTELKGAGSCVFISKNLSRENNGDRFVSEIKELQRMLVQKNYLNSTDVTGYFGPVTRNAVINLQIDNGLITSRTSDAAGLVGPRTRAFIQENTCGSADITKTTTTVSSFKASVSARKNVLVDSIVGEQIMTLTLKPSEANATLRHLVLQVETEDEDIKPSAWIDYIDVYGRGIVSRTRASAASWRQIDDTTYAITLDGDATELEKNTDNEFQIRIVPKRSQQNAEQVEFTAVLPENGVRISFENVNGNSTGVQMWGAPETEAVFLIGSGQTDDETETPIDDGGVTVDDEDEEDTSTTTTTTTVVAAPKLGSIKPNQGSFGELIVLTGKNFSQTNNKILIKHPGSNSETVLHGYPSRADKIIIQFPGKNREFVRPNGTTVSGKTGNYRIQVISNNKTSNGETFKIVK